MPQTDKIKEIARLVLTSAAFDGRADNWLWDRTERVANNIKMICNLPELSEANLPVDRFCLSGAGYFFETGLIQYANSKGAYHDGRSEQDISEVRRMSAWMVSERLAGSVDEKKIEKINRIIVESGEKPTKLNEAKVLSDAANLEDVGSVGICNQVRQLSLQKKSISELVNSWKKKVDYGYWQARLKESFYFESVKAIANERFAVMGSFMENLEKESELVRLVQSLR
jgi:hypothetical protein